METIAIAIAVAVVLCAAAWIIWQCVRRGE